MEAMNVSAPIFTVLYNNKNITADLNKYLLSLTYDDKEHGESDEIQIELEDVDGLWQNTWYPEKGAKLTVTIGQLNCGVFEIDEIEIKGPPDVVTIKGVATGITKSLRTKKSSAHENKSLKQIAKTVADANGLDFIDLIGLPDLNYNRISQNKETDLAFLKRIGGDHGVVFAVRENKITFNSVYDLEKRDISFTIDKSELETFSLKDKADGMIKNAKVKSKNAKKNGSIEANVDYQEFQEEEGYKYDDVPSDDEDVDSSRVENTQQAEAKAKANMHLAATNQQTGMIEIQFNPLACAGNNFQITGIGKISGKYHIRSSSHKIDKPGGAISTCDIKRLKTPAVSEQITHKKKKTQPNSVFVSRTALEKTIFGQDSEFN